MGVRRDAGSRKANQGDSAKAEALLDEALQETFPASDPIAPYQEPRDAVALERRGARRLHTARR
jgi:hypothetical protein